MAVLTHKEYSEKNTKKVIVSEVDPILITETKIKKPEFIYYLFHPDSSRDAPKNGKYYVFYNGKEYPMSIINGVVTTMIEEIKNILERSGFVFMYQREVDDR